MADNHFSTTENPAAIQSSCHAARVKTGFNGRLITAAALAETTRATERELRLLNIPQEVSQEVSASKKH